MKKLFYGIIFLFFGIKLFAQDDIQKIQEAWGKDKRELVGIGMELSPADSIKFWPVYDKYETERQKISRERLITLSDYAETYERMSNAKADEIINKLFKYDIMLTQLQQRFYTNFKTTLNAIQAARFIQVETYIQTTIRSKLQGALPVIGEIDSLKKD